jgi:exosortase/archaeosortase family protein
VYFIFGLFGTYFVNVLRIYSILIVMMNYGDEAGRVFHNSYGELYFFTWIFLYILLIVCIQRFMLVEKIRYAPSKLGSLLAAIKKKV